MKTTTKRNDSGSAPTARGGCKGATRRAAPRVKEPTRPSLSERCPPLSQKSAMGLNTSKVSERKREEELGREKVVGERRSRRARVLRHEVSNRHRWKKGKGKKTKEKKRTAENTPPSSRKPDRRHPWRVNHGDPEREGVSSLKQDTCSEEVHSSRHCGESSLDVEQRSGQKKGNVHIGLRGEGFSYQKSSSVCGETAR